MLPPTLPTMKYPSYFDQIRFHASVFDLLHLCPFIKKHGIQLTLMTESQTLADFEHRFQLRISHAQNFSYVLLYP